MTKYGIDSTVIHQIIDLANRHHIKGQQCMRFFLNIQSETAYIASLHS